MGHRHPDPSRRRDCVEKPAGRAVSGGSPPANRVQRHLSGRFRAGGGRHGNQAHRTADERHRTPAVHGSLVRTGIRHVDADLRARHRHRHFLGGGAEPLQARRVAPARRSAPARRAGHQAAAQLPDVCRHQLQRWQAQCHRSRQLCGGQRARSAATRTGRRRGDPVRHRILDANLAETGTTHRLRSDAGRREKRIAGAERTARRAN